MKKSRIILETRNSLMAAELHRIIVEFGLAMTSANKGYIANSGKFTPNMEAVWNQYVVWCADNRKKGEE